MHKQSFVGPARRNMLQGSGSSCSGPSISVLEDEPEEEASLEASASPCAIFFQQLLHQASALASETLENPSADCSSLSSYG